VSKVNPNDIDYNKDGTPDEFDDALAVQDLNKDGKVTDKEKKTYQQKQSSSSTTYTYNKDGSIASQKTTGGPKPVEPSLTAEGYGFNQKFLTANADIKDAIKKAIQNDWPQEVLNRFIESSTEFGKRTTDAQAFFDINIDGEKSEDLQNQVDEKYSNLKRQAEFSGVNISDQELQRFATESIRSGLSENDTFGWISEQYKQSTSKESSPDSASLTLSSSGTASDIQDQLKTLANSYGIRVTDDLLREKTGEALGQGERWREWVSGQEDFFKQQAKIMYPKAAQMLDTMSLKQISEPYFADAADVLGISAAQMDLLDPKWTGFLNGQSGVLSRDEWERVLKTDSKYGWDKTNKAREEYSSLADSLLSAFGMA
jgi:hypothetical protein